MHIFPAIRINSKRESLIVKIEVYKYGNFGYTYHIINSEEKEVEEHDYSYCIIAP